jgi:hypothetical protein
MVMAGVNLKLTNKKLLKSLEKNGGRKKFLLA